MIAYIGIKDKQQKIVKVKLINIENYGYVKSAGYYEGKLSFEDINDNASQYFATLCRDNWPNIEVNSYYQLNLTELANNTRLNGMLAGCYLGNLDRLFSK